VAGANAATSIFGGRSARKRAKAELLEKQVADENAAQLQITDDASQAAAANDQLRLAGEREVLADQAEAEGLRQARLAAVSPDVEIASVTGDERRRRRAAFYEGNV
jgi:hypothetical protein